jgi:replicative DNA helicase
MRLGQGKTWMLCDITARAAKCGYNVGIASLEMRDKVWGQRVALRLAGRDAAVTRALRSQVLGEQKEALDHLQKVTPGKVEIFDPSHGQVNTTSFVSEMCRDYDLVIVDHAGLLMTSDGRRAIDDWRAMAVISNTLREITLATTTSVVAAAQINREGERSGSQSPPKTSQLSQSDALGQDGDVVVTGKRLSNRVSVFDAAKVRNGPNLRWWVEFDIARNRIEEITHDRATELGVLDEDLKVNVD